MFYGKFVYEVDNPNIYNVEGGDSLVARSRTQGNWKCAENSFSQFT